ncbi:nuclear transport factor 2 family protein [Tychonema sp. LEGE 07199]|uniref:nuclear transport factor 2 family protein n=1 Tax=unclassified Tychonema TaxID=2642144 RepID=UPI0018830FDE|nr:MULTISPECIES: nuclear transport factor 2 family protein [unclassified Tychonema]MBE9119420.1 nuclear transport factor 2 family protein [Tychonema sp. LEGE 07199]MBE9131034.1 nuclear transport factor 2 family protein [Tychonema sp. LEGE 07196]
MIFTADTASELARDWIEAWNSHNLDRIMSHYAEDVILISPVAAKLLNEPSGTVTGKEALGNYFKKGLEVYPDLKFELLDVMWGVSSVVLYYINQKGTKTGEFMEVGSRGKVTKVVAHYNG